MEKRNTPKPMTVNEIMRITFGPARSMSFIKSLFDYKFSLIDSFKLKHLRAGISREKVSYAQGMHCFMSNGSIYEL